MTKIKICGLSRPCDIDFVNAAMPDYIGFIFAKSPRQVSPVQAKALRLHLKDAIIPIGVFVNASIDEIETLHRQGTIAMAQLHGKESKDYIKKLKQRCSIPIIKAVGIEDHKGLISLEDSAADFFIFDNQDGGTGKPFDWRQIPTCKKPFFLAGGINPSNIEQVFRYHPYCIDVSSGAETEGKKDKKKILELVQKVKGGTFHGCYSKIQC